jgi:hypothetical protein
MTVDEIFAKLGGIRPAGSGAFQPLSGNALAAIENLIDAKLPELYKSILSQYGAFAFNGRSENDPYVFFRSLSTLPSYITGSGVAIFDFFYGAELEPGPLGLVKQIAFFKGRIPQEMIPIGGDGGAGQICLGIKGAEAGKVYYWDQRNEPLDEEDYLEEYGEPRPPEAMFQNVHQIADSFEDFLQRLELRVDA